jgi:LPXTG-site transpeptidase (sortase) family protein
MGVALFLVLLFYFLFKNEIQNSSSLLAENSSVISKQEQVSFGLPLRLKIPKINVDAAIEYVGLTPDGAMDIPKSPDEVVWFELGQRPGENGSAVIAGHYGWKDGKAAAFDNLDQLRKGDKLYIEDDKGVIISFVVRESRKYDPSADASEVFSLNDGKSHLNLITCEGVWNKDSGSYSQRLVVFTDKE